MTITVATHRDLDSVQTDWLDLEAQGAAHHVFQTIEWARAWWETLGSPGETRPQAPAGADSDAGNNPRGRQGAAVNNDNRGSPVRQRRMPSGHFHSNKGGDRGLLVILKVEDGGRVIGLAPMLETDGTATLLGDKDVCDYLDAVALPGFETGVAQALLDYFGAGRRSLDLFPLRPDGILYQLVSPASARGITTQVEAIDVSFDLPLPHSWDEYLKRLKRADRHELRRKLRNLYASGKVCFYSRIPNPADMDDFLRLFRISREDKTAFMTPAREGFFRRLARDLGDKHWLQLSFLELDGVKVATAVCFDYNNTMYLYNSGYDPDYAPLSVGLLCKVMTIMEAIDKGRGRYDFLRGAEDYKFHLGGKPLPIHRIVLSS